MGLNGSSRHPGPPCATPARDTDPVPDDAPVPQHDVSNTAHAGVSGTAVQAHTITGGVHLHHHRAPHPAVTFPHRIGVVPPRAAAFQNRRVSTLVAQALKGTAAVARASDDTSRTVVLSGLGGVGKTQVAADCAERMWAAGEVELLIWLTAGSREAIVSGYARAAAALTGVDDADPEQGARSLLEWLAGTSLPWLVVLDDLQCPGDVTGLWPPTTTSSRVIATTRRRDAALRGYRRRLIDVEVFSAEEAGAYLRTVLTDRTGSLDGATELAQELGFLPLALAQAGAYVVDRQLSCAAYLTRLADRLLANVVPEPAGLPDEHRLTVAATWSLSVEQADRLPPEGLARPLLDLASVLDANGVPAAVFTAPAALDLLTSATGRVIDELEARDGLGCLHRLSLITLDAGTPSRAVRVHALVQRANRDAWPGSRAAAVVRAAADAVLQSWPEIQRDTVLAQIMRANAGALLATGGAGLWEPDGHGVLVRSGSSLGESGLVAAARDYFGRLRDTTTRHLGADHPDTLTARHHMARWRGETGDPAGAAAEFEHLLVDRLRVLGPDHPDTLASRHNLASWRGKAGELASAAAALDEVLADRLRVLGPDHPDTLATRLNLAYWQGEAGDPAGAMRTFGELFADQLRILGPDHLYTLIVRHNVAYWQGKAGDPAGAAAALADLLTDLARVLGPDHPDTLAARFTLARVRGEAGDPAGAAAAHEQLLTDQLRVLGPDHPDTSTIRDQLTHWKRMSDRPGPRPPQHEADPSQPLRGASPP
jgi:hypothetical protein